MLREYLQLHPLEPMLREEERNLYPPASDRDAWDGITDACRREIREMAETFGRDAYPLRSAAGFLAFSRTGSRQADEVPYFARRRKLCAAVLECCAFPESDPDSVIDGVWLICEESSWVISAHNINPVPGAPEPRDYPLPDIRKPYVDLFSAQTGMILSLTASLLGERLDRETPILRERIRLEVQRRILDPFMERDDFWWMGTVRKDLNNWTPWILSNVMVCAVLSGMNRRELADLLTRGCGMLDRYLDVIPEDGGCDEGAGYWNVAGGALLDCLCLLEKVTGGEMAFWQEPKIRNILSFPRKVELGGGWFTNFADCDARPSLSGERLERAGEKTGDRELAELGTRMRGTLADPLLDTPHLTRVLDMIFHPALRDAGKTERKEKDEYLPDLQVRILERNGWTLACKGGHNAESHNHNDAGSFILFADGEPVIVDAGNVVYTAKTFSAERYSQWNVRGAYHNLPLFGEQEEREGREHGARNAAATPEGMEMDLETAYGAEAGVSAFHRAFRLTETGLTLTDTGTLRTETEITWIFLLRNRPEIRENRAETGRWVLEYPAGMAAETEEIPVTDGRMAKNWPGSLWRLKIRSRGAETFRGVFILRKK